jgi:hypothetical protein
MFVPIFYIMRNLTHRCVFIFLFYVLFIHYSLEAKERDHGGIAQSGATVDHVS